MTVGSENWSVGDVHRLRRDDARAGGDVPGVMDVDAWGCPSVLR